MTRARKREREREIEREHARESACENEAYPAPMMSAAADVKPERTGWESSRVTKPILKRPMASCRDAAEEGCRDGLGERESECTRESEREERESARERPGGARRKRMLRWQG